MEIIIKIPEEDYERLKGYKKAPFCSLTSRAYEAIANGTPLPKGHGDLIDRNLALSDGGLCEFHMYDDYVKMRNYLKSIQPVIEVDKGSEDKE